VKELDEIAGFFKNVPKEKRQDFLYGMCTDGYDSAALEQQSFYKPAPPDYDNEYEQHIKEEAANRDYKADYEAYAKKQRDAANLKTSAELNYGSSTAQKLQSGLQIARASCSTNDIDEVKVVIRKLERGDNPISHQKTCSKVVCALKPEISAGNISRILTSNNEAQHNVASNALSWQSILKNLKRYCIQYDMNSILMIPQDVDYKNPAMVSKACVFFNAIDDWQKLEDKDYLQWQEFVLC
jgi:hypothetical protein